ncbi:deoxyguanosinetriphosphate triphosphohydrolase [soil metagenome]
MGFAVAERIYDALLTMDTLQSHLAPYAMTDEASRGRRHAEAPHPFRTAFQRDRERIVHSSAFRRMTGKTQVLVASVNDHHRTRLTHTLEVTQVARTVARRLGLNEDLTEAIALAHDIGHPPYGHSGEQALHECLLQHGGFNHNLYGVRRVDELEERYPEFPGLNLTFEVREAFIQHAKMLNVPEAAEFKSAGSPLLEAQVVDIVDSIAYDTHDLDDALGLGFIAIDDLCGLELVQRALSVVRVQHANLPAHTLRTAMIREVLSIQVNGLLDETARRLQAYNIRTLQDVRSATLPLVGFADELALQKGQLEHFLQTRVYRHHKVLRMTANGKRILRALFAEYVATPELLPERQLRRWSGATSKLGNNAELSLPGRRTEQSIERVVGDYLAGMTDRFAQQEYRRLFSPSHDS